MINMSKSPFQKSVNWTDYLNFPRGKVYHGSFSTDGVSVSVRFEREKIECVITAGPNQAYGGIDPSWATAFTGRCTFYGW